MSFDTGGDVGILGGKTTQESSFGQRLAPPTVRGEQKSQGVAIVCVGLAIIGLVIGIVRMQGAKPSDRTSGWYWIATAVLVGGFGVASWIARQKEIDAIKSVEARYQAKAVAEWSKQWVCYQCGAIFLPTAGDDEDGKAEPIPPRAAAPSATRRILRRERSR